MSTATISIGIEPAIKRAATANVKNAGVDLKTAVRWFINRLAKEPAAVEELHIPNEETRRSIYNLEHGIGVTRVSSIEELNRAVGWE